MGDRGDDLRHVGRHPHDHAVGVEGVRLLVDDGGLDLGVGRVVGADLAAEAVLERRDDPTPVRVVLGVGRADEQQVERQADLVAPHLDVALLQHVEQADLDALGEVGQLVHGEDAAVGAGHDAVVEGQLVGQVATLGHLDGVDLADQVGDRGVGRRQLLAEAVLAVDPVDPGVLAVLGHQVPGVLRDRVVGVVVDLRTGDDRHPLVEQVHERADQAGLGLAPLAQEDDVVAGQEGVLELGDDRVLIAQHAREQWLAGADLGDRVAPQLLFDRAGHPSGLAELAEGGGSRRHVSTVVASSGEGDPAARSPPRTSAAAGPSPGPPTQARGPPTREFSPAAVHFASPPDGELASAKTARPAGWSLDRGFR